MRTRYRALVFVLALAAAPAFAAVDVAGVKFEDKLKLGGSELTLNGAGLRSKVFFKVYAIGLYLPEKKSGAEDVLGTRGPRRIRIVTLRDVTAQQFADALIDSLRQNNSEAELAAISAAVDAFKSTLLSLKTAPKGTDIAIDYRPVSGTQLLMNGQPKDSAILGEDFYRALLKVWLGGNPVQGDLKDALLGKSG